MNKDNREKYHMLGYFYNFCLYSKIRIFLFKNSNQLLSLILRHVFELKYFSLFVLFCFVIF